MPQWPRSAPRSHRSASRTTGDGAWRAWNQSGVGIFFESAYGLARLASVLFHSSPQAAGPEFDCKLASRAARARRRSSTAAAGLGSLITFFARVPQTQLLHRGLW